MGRAPPPRFLKPVTGRADTRGVRLSGRTHPTDGALFRLSILTAAASLGAMVAAVPSSDGSPALAVLLAGVVLAAAVAVVAGRHVISQHVQLLAPAATLLAVVLVRHASGGDRLRYELLLLLPILWLALQGSLAELVVGIAGLSIGLAALNVSSGQEMVGWSNEVLFVLVALAIGTTVQQLIEQVRRQAGEVASITRVVRDVATETDAEGARAAVCRAACEICDAQLAMLLEPNGFGRLVVSAAEGSDVALGTLVPLDGVDELVREALDRGEQLVLPDVGGSLCAAAVGARTALLAPVTRDGHPAGALVVGWQRSMRRLPARMTQIIELFTVEMARSIERGDLIAQVHEHANDLEAVVEIVAADAAPERRPDRARRRLPGRVGGMRRRAGGADGARRHGLPGVHRRCRYRRGADARSAGRPARGDGIACSGRWSRTSCPTCSTPTSRSG